jgi:hypothetical protein
MVAGLVVVLLLAVVGASISYLGHLGSSAVLSSTSSAPGPTSTTITSPATASGALKGLTFSPRNYTQAGISDFFTKASASGGVVEWAGDWQQLGDQSGAPALVASQSSQDGLKAMIVVQFFSQSTGQLIRPLNSSNKANYVQMAANFAGRYKVAYFGVGIEVNVLYEKNLTAYQQFVGFFPQVYDAIKSSSPTTSVFTIFQFERLNGLQGGLYGGLNNQSNSEWQLIRQFPKEDVLAFTTYPGLIFHSPSDLPSDYYSSIASHSTLPVGFTEVGWQSANATVAWPSSQTDQAEFVSNYFRLTRGTSLAFTVWSFLYDPSGQAPFDSMGLFTASGTPKQAWAEWTSG